MQDKPTSFVTKAFEIANDEAIKRGHEYIGTEHILLGLLPLRGSLADAILRQFVDVRALWYEVEKRGQREQQTVVMGRKPQTPRAKKVMTYSYEEAMNLQCNQVGTDHLLLGLLRENEGVAAEVLKTIPEFNLNTVRERARALRANRQAQAKLGVTESESLPVCAEVEMGLALTVLQGITGAATRLEAVQKAAAILSAFAELNKQVHTK